MMEDENDKDLQELLALAAALPKEIDPPEDAWAKIRSAIENEAAAPDESASPRIAGAGPAPRDLRRPVFWQRPAYLAAAALLLVASSSAVTAVLVREKGGNARPAVDYGPGDKASSPREIPASLAEFTIRENEYISQANQLAEIFESPESKLSPETRAKLTESLAIIDAAILEARRALAADPANAAIVDLLTGSYEKKLDLLRRSGEMARS